jgi:xanthine/CO dehydrogenase XdhC/CoxF family maturation factor
VSADVFAAMAEARQGGRTVVMGTTVRTEGDPPSAPGNRALFTPDGALLAGTIGCNGLDRKAGADLGRLHSPTGLDLGARRPPEIALSILAEVMAVTHARPGGSLSIVDGAEESPE